MTTKHVVADDTMGKVAKKLWELQRRVMEGTLDPNKILTLLQHFIEGHTLPIEQLPYQVSNQVYQLRIPPRKDIKSRANWRIPVVDSHGFISDAIKGPRRSSVRLARFLETRRLAEVRTILRNAGEIPADAWELLAFAEQGHFTDVKAKQPTTIWSVVRAGRVDYPDSHPPSTHSAYLKLFERCKDDYGRNTPQGWKFEFQHEWEEEKDITSMELCKVEEDDYVLLRYKSE